MADVSDAENAEEDGDCRLSAWSSSMAEKLNIRDALNTSEPRTVRVRHNRTKGRSECKSALCAGGKKLLREVTRE